MSAGDHTHGGTTDVQGSHGHNVPAPSSKGNAAGPGATATSLWSGDAGLAGATDAQGNHAHNLNISVAGAHTHGIALDGAHTHVVTVNAAADHTHPIPADGNHTHAVTTVSMGGGAAHPSVPPGAVATFAIKT